MSRHHPHLITALALCALPLAGCSTSPAQETSAPSSAAASASSAPTAWPTSSNFPTPEVPGDGTFPAVEDVDRTDVDSTARAAAILLHSWDTVVDRTETAAAIRAKPLMSDEWAGHQVEPERNSSQGAWLDPASHGAYSRAQAVPAIGDTTRDVADDKAVRAYKVTWRWASRDGEPAEGTGTRHVTIYLERHSGAWEVVGHQSHDLPAGGGHLVSVAVHTWPVITLTFGAEQIVADANWEVLTYPVLDAATAHEVAADAATEACRRLGLKACRVQGHTEDGSMFEMVVDAELGTLEEYEPPAGPGPTGPSSAERSAARRGGSTARTRTAGARSGNQRRRALAIWGSVGILGLTAGTSVAMNLTEDDREPVAVVHTPPPAQLPVPAPAGWDTYGAWATPMSGSQVKAVLDWEGRPVSVEGSKLIGHDPDTGVEQWSRTAPFTVTQLAVFTVDGQTRLAAATAKELVLFTPDSADPIRVQVPQEATVVLDGGTVPRLDLPTKKSLLVAADGSTATRVVPAVAKPLEAQGADLIAADAKAGKVWRVGTDSAALPKPATLPAPAKGAELTGILGSVEGRVVAAWKDGKQTLVGFYDLDEATEATAVKQVAVRELDGNQITTSTVQTDRVHGLLLASTVLIDVEATTAHRLEGQATLAAGYAWVTDDGEQAQVTRDGATEATTRADQAAVPDVITDNGMALTRVDGSADGSLYALVETGPTPTASPTASTSPTASPTPTAKETP